MKQKIINLFAGPGAGKSTAAAGAFFELKCMGVDVELVCEEIKKDVYEGRPYKLFTAQDYIFSRQNFVLSNLVGEVDLIVTDSPLLMNLAYLEDIKNYQLPSLTAVIREAHSNYDSLNIIIQRSFGYSAIGRLQTEDEAIAKDKQIEQLLFDNGCDSWKLKASKTIGKDIVKIVRQIGWL